MAGDIDSFETSADQPTIVAVSFQTAGHLHNYLSAGLPLKRGDRVLVGSNDRRREFQLPGATERVGHVHVDLRPVEGAVAFVERVLETMMLERVLQRQL